MALIELTLSPEYQRSEWGVKEALREIISNALDGQTRGKPYGTGKMSLEYSKRGKVLRIKNEKTTIPTSALLMGASGSRGNDDCIGTFGEGLPMSLLVLARKGMEVVIFNGKEKWTPSLAHSERFETTLLTIQTRQLVTDRDDFVVELHDIEPDEYEMAQSMFLSLDPRFDPEQRLEGMFSKAAVLMQPELKGRLYNRGVFVQKRDDLLFGYDLDTRLNRDRSIMDEYEVKHKINDALDNVLDQHPERFAEEILPMLFYGHESLEGMSDWGSLHYSSKFKELITNEWESKYGADCIAVRSEEELQQARNIGLRAVIVGPMVRRVMNEVNGSLADALTGQDAKVIRVYGLHELSGEEQMFFTQAESLVRAVSPVMTTVDVKIVEFGGKKREFGLYNSEIARVMLMTEASAYRGLAKLASDAESSGSDRVVEILSLMLVEQRRRLHG